FPVLPGRSGPAACFLNILVAPSLPDEPRPDTDFFVGFRGIVRNNTMITSCGAKGGWQGPDDSGSGVLLRRGHLAADKILGAARHSNSHGWVSYPSRVSGTQSTDNVVMTKFARSAGHFSPPLGLFSSHCSQNTRKHNP